MTDTEKVIIQNSAKNYAVISFILGLLSILNFCSGCLFFVPIISLILGITANNKSKSIGMPNEGLAIAGIVLSIICLVGGILQLIMGFAAVGLTALPICFLAPFAGTSY